MTSRPARVARGAVTGLFATVVAAVLHVSAGGVAPSVLALVVAVTFATLLGTALTSRRASLPRLVVAVGLSQAAFHLGFSYLGAGLAVASSAAHDHHSTVQFATSAATNAGHSGHGDGALMWVAHIAAGVATIAFLCLAERAVWSLVAEAVRLLVAVFRMPVPGSSKVGAARRPAAEAAIPLLDVLATSVSRRGPPRHPAFA